MTAKRVLVTGATGLLGSHLLPPLVTAGCQVHAVTRKPVENRNVHWMEADLTDDDWVGRLPDQADAVIHLAQSRFYREFPGQADDIFAVNLASTARLLDWARCSQVRTFVYASSGGIYGHGDQDFREDDFRPVGPLSYYLVTKRASELLAEPYQDSFTLVVLRFFFMYGSGQSPDMLMPRLVDRVRQGEPIALQGSDGIRINPVHVSDAVAAVVAALDLDVSTKINVAGPEVLTMRQIGHVIGEAVGREPVFETQEDSPRHLVGDVTRMSSLLAAPRVQLEDGIRDLVR